MPKLNSMLLQMLAYMPGLHFVAERCDGSVAEWCLLGVDLSNL